MPYSDVVIAGAGIIGLSAALELALHGLSVTVLEQGAAMREASWAAAGMLAAHDPENPPQLRALADLSLALYPEFLSTVARLSGLTVPLRSGGTLQGSHRGRVATDALTPHALRALVPDLVPGTRSFGWLNEHSLDPRDLCRALPLAFAAAGGTLHKDTAVQRVGHAGAGLRIETSQGAYTAAHYLHCCGAWSALPRVPGGLALPVEPRKGQMVSVTMPAGTPRLGCVIRTPELYLVPRGLPGAADAKARIVIGATVEQAGFDRTVTDAATASLLAQAAELWPPIQHGRVDQCWTGLRPGSPDGMPILGALSDDAALAGAWVATGHFRNGILLAPGTARVLTQLLLGRRPGIDLHAFRLARFAAVEAAS